MELFEVYSGELACEGLIFALIGQR